MEFRATDANRITRSHEVAKSYNKCMGSLRFSVEYVEGQIATPFHREALGREKRASLGFLNKLHQSLQAGCISLQKNPLFVGDATFLKNRNILGRRKETKRPSRLPNM